MKAKIDIKGALLCNSSKKINGKFKEILEKGHQVINPIGSRNYEDKFNFLCPAHGEYQLTGLDIRQGHQCPKCENSTYVDKVEKIITSTKPFETFSELVKIEAKRKNLTSPNTDGITFVNFHDTIRPECPEHGEFLTTPKKLLEGDSCKWCDGQITHNGITQYRLNRYFRLDEKIRIKSDQKESLFFGNIGVLPDEHKLYPNSFIQVQNIETQQVQWAQIKDYNKPNKNYTWYLKNIKNPDSRDSIFFKLSITDKSSKMKFTLPYVIYLTPEHKEYFNNTATKNDWDQNTVEEWATPQLINNWFQSIFHEGITKKTQEKFEFEVIHSEWNTQFRSFILIQQYHHSNKDKVQSLPDSILAKFVPRNDMIFYWSEIQWDSTSNSIQLFRESRLKDVSTCPICKRKVDQAVVDHEHKKKVKGTGRVRDNICNMCNTFISRVENNCKRHKIDLTLLPEVLLNISEYFSTQQYPIIHYTDKDKKPKLKKSVVNKVIKYFPLLFPGKKMKSVPKSMTVTKDWAIYVSVTEKYLENPYSKLTKTNYNKIKNNWNRLYTGKCPEYPSHGLMTNDWAHRLKETNSLFIK